MRLFVSDLDGTLLNRNFVISEKNVQAIHTLDTGNIRFVVATGRIYSDAYAICKAHGLNPYIISNNGSCIFNDKKELIYGKWIMSRDVKQISDYLEHMNICYGLGTSMELLVPDKWKDTYLQEIQRLKAGGMFIASDKIQFTVDEMVSQQGLVEVSSKEELWERGCPCSSISIISHDMDKLNQIKDYISQFKHLTTSISGTHNMEIMSISGSKDLAVEFLAGLFDISMDQVVAIGDGLNDKELIEKAGLGIAMGNAADEVKKVSSYVTRNCMEDGVAHAITELMEMIQL